jgi:hypothetical protein
VLLLILNMLIQCYQGYKGTFADDYCYNLVIKLGGWTRLGIDTILFFVPENRAELLILAHPQLLRRPDQDYIA